MLFIVSTLWDKNRASTIEDFQLAVDASISSLTLVSACKNNLGETAVYMEDVGNHLSPHTLILSPLPTLHLRPFLTRCWAAMTLRQVKEGLFPSEAFTKSLFGKYLALRTLYTNEFWPICSPHPCFAKRAKLKSFKILKPLPPHDFGLHIFSQLSQAVFFSSLVCPH